MMEAIAIMITLHLIADFPAQGDFLANIKGSNTYLLLCHSFMWAGIIYFGLMYLGMASPWEFYFLAIVHAAIDKWKCSRPDKSKALTTDLYIDQSLHAVQILVAMYVF